MKLKTLFVRRRRVISKKEERIEYREFADKGELESIVIPGTVKIIGIRAFENCKGLKSVELCEGIETLRDYAFAGCERLRSIRLPASLKDVNGRAFSGAGLTEPVLSADGRTLVYYPETSETTEYSVPEGVEEIGACAFIEMKRLAKVRFPQSLKRIRRRAFASCGVVEVEIPIGAEVEFGAFSGAEKGFHVVRRGQCSALAARQDTLYAEGASFLCARRMKAPEDKYWLNADFRALAARCAAGDVRAMEEMCDCFENKEAVAEDKAQACFYGCAAQFWRVRAWRYGSASAEAFLEKWVKENEANARMVSPGLTERLSGTSDGDALNALGFLFFAPHREYALDGTDECGMVETSSYAGEDGPDEDGFGAEIYYDWWYLDDCLNLPEGARYISGFTHSERNDHEQQFLELREETAVLAEKARRNAL